MDLGLTDGTIIVTGGTNGVGLATTELLLAEGARVAVCGRDPDRLVAALDRFNVPDRLLGVEADVLKPDEVANLVTTVVDR